MKPTVASVANAMIPVLIVLSAGAAQAQDERGIAARSESRVDGPPPPVSPAVITRDDQGNATIRAIQLASPIQLDGQLDEAVYRDAPPITGFIQTLPDEGAPATEETEAWVTFDAENVYVSARLWDSAPESEWVANEMRRDTNQLRNNDTFSASFDTYYDRRNAFNFYTNPLGARADLQFMNEGARVLTRTSGLLFGNGLRNSFTVAYASRDTVSNHAERRLVLELGVLSASPA